MNRLAAMGLLLAVTACAVRSPPLEPTRTVVPVRSCLVLVVFSPEIAHLCDSSARRELRGAVSKALLDSGSYRVLETEILVSRAPTPVAARRLAETAGAECVALLRLHHFEIRTKVHHVRKYHDASAAGELVLVRREDGTVERSARQTVHVSSRARYSGTAHVRDAVLTRLAEQLTADLLRQPAAGSS